MPRGFPKNKRTVICKGCSESFESNSHRVLYCKPCKSKRPWDKWELDYKKKLTRLCHMAKHRAINKSLDFNITSEHLIKLWEENEGKCALTGRLFDLSKWGEKSQVNPNGVSVDRIKPSLGYVQGNVRLIVYHLNVALSDFGEQAFENLCKDYLTKEI